MRCTVTRAPEGTILRLGGRITIGPALETLRRELETLIAEGRTRIVVDLREVTYVDSATLGQIVAGRRQAAECGGRLVLAGPRGKVRDLLDLTRIGDLIEIFEGTAEALASFPRG